jgi:anti-sigma regulatory factor (Ser/Thr protein kinase)
MDTLTMPAQLSSLEPLLSFALERTERLGASRELLQDIRLALEEILTNVFFYAYPGVEKPVLEVGFSAQSSRELSFRITDWGIPFNPLGVDAPDLGRNLSERKTGGMGIYLVRNVAHELAYERSSDANHLTLIFRLGTDLEGASS